MLLWVFNTQYIIEMLFWVFNTQYIIFFTITILKMAGISPQESSSECVGANYILVLSCIFDFCHQRVNDGHNCKSL